MVAITLSSFKNMTSALIQCTSQVLVLDASGKAIAATRGLVTAGDLQQTLTQAVSKFHAQVNSAVLNLCPCLIQLLML